MSIKEYERTSFDKLRVRILEYGIRDMKMSEDKITITFILMNGEVYDVCTTEEDVNYAVCNDWNFIQSEIDVYQKVEP